MTPTSLATRTTTIAGITLTLHVLDDGRRVIEQQSIDRILQAMEDGTLLPADAVRMAAWAKHGGTDG